MYEGESTSGVWFQRCSGTEPLMPPKAASILGAISGLRDRHWGLRSEGSVSVSERGMKRGQPSTCPCPAYRPVSPNHCSPTSIWEGKKHKEMEIVLSECWLCAQHGFQFFVHATLERLSTCPWLTALTGRTGWGPGGVTAQSVPWAWAKAATRCYHIEDMQCQGLHSLTFYVF